VWRNIEAQETATTSTGADLWGHGPPWMKLEDQFSSRGGFGAKTELTIL
jgi:hypothetical protein